MEQESNSLTPEEVANDLDERIDNTCEAIERLEGEHASTERDIEAMKGIVEEIADQMETLIGKMEAFERQKNGDESTAEVGTGRMFQ